MTREQDLHRWEARLTEWEARIKRLEAAVDRLEGREKDICQRDLEQLRAERESIATHVRDLRLEEAEGWADLEVRNGVLRIFDAFGERLDRLMSRTGSSRH
ncbi:hypothetical protein HUS23_04845 [Ectothiorhodospiraceae bacterium 2226]|nr:hypothetical protein HUS23_04845 [Ectothiorhodospiraceae bacterium 2226]